MGDSLSYLDNLLVTGQICTRVNLNNNSNSNFYWYLGHIPKKIRELIG